MWTMWMEYLQIEGHDMFFFLKSLIFGHLTKVTARNKYFILYNPFKL